MPKDVFIILSGGPGRYDPKDPKHDQSWANYVSPALLRMSRGTLPLDKAREEVHWLVYEPAYIARWTDDLTSKRADQRRATQEVKNKGFSDYLDKLRTQAASRGWVYKGLSVAQDFFTYLNILKLQRVSRVWYYGHARDDLWLSLEHDSTHQAIEPAAEAVVRLSDIKTLKAFNFVRHDRSRPHRFFGCNTKAFARAWAAHLKVHTEGCAGDVLFDQIYDTWGMPTLDRGARWYQLSHTGAQKLILSKYKEEVR